MTAPLRRPPLPPPPLPATRRRLLGQAVALPLAAALGACGFQLRQAPQLAFRSIQLKGFAQRSPLGLALRQQIDASETTRVVEAASLAQVILDVLSDGRERTVVASTSASQVREIQLRTRFQFQLRTAGDKPLIAPTELLLTRDMSYSERLALAKEQEESALFEAMQADIVAQVMRRLAAVKL